MAADVGRCPYCGQENPRSRTVCSKCNEELPWAAWVRAAQGGEPEPIGAGARSEADLRSRALDVGGGLASGSLIRLATIVGPLLAVLVVGYFVLRGMSAPVHQAAQGPLGNALSGSGNAAQRFEKANPAIRAKDEQ